MRPIIKICVKQIKGTGCNLEVEPLTTILEIKQQVEEKLNVMASCQRLIYLGKTLDDKKTVSCYPAIKNGAKLILFVIKPEGLYDATLKYYKAMALSDAEAGRAAVKFLNVMKVNIDRMSWDDIDKLSADFMLVKDGERPMTVEEEMDCAEE